MSISDIERLIQLLARLPGLGPRSARRAVLHLMKKRESLMLPLAEAMSRAAANIRAPRLTIPLHNIPSPYGKGLG